MHYLMTLIINNNEIMGVHACVRACVRACLRVCVHACVRACVPACVCACMCKFPSSCCLIYLMQCNLNYYFQLLPLILRLIMLTDD